MKRILSMMIIGILCLSIFSIIAPRGTGTASETPLQIAEKAATWTISQAIYDSGGYKWLDYLTEPYYSSTVPFGSAGFGTFYLELYKKTGNSMYLDYAKGAAQWVVTQVVPDSGGYKWPHPDNDIHNPGWWLSPMVSGIGDFLLGMYQTTGDTTYLDYATGAANWLTAMAYFGEPGCFIPYNPPGPYGTQAAHGIGPGREAYTMTFLLHMYEETGNSAYLPYIQGMATWLISGPDKITESDGYTWIHNRPYGSSLSIEGTARIALFFYEIYQVLGNAEYLQHANGAMNWLLDRASQSGDQAKWLDLYHGYYRVLPFSDMGGVEGFWGMPEPNDFLTSAYEITKNATYLDYTRKLANWIISPTIAVPEGGGYKFPDIQGSSFYSAYQNAKIYNFLSWLYSVTGETLYRDYADGALQWIIFNATETNGGYEWRTIPWFPYYATWFEPGAAGIGYYLVSGRASVVQLVFTPPYDSTLSGHGGRKSEKTKQRIVGFAEASYYSSEDPTTGYAYLFCDVEGAGAAMVRSKATAWFGRSWTCEKSAVYTITFVWNWHVEAASRAIFACADLSGTAKADLIELSADNTEVNWWSIEETFWKNKLNFFKMFGDWSYYDETDTIRLVLTAELKAGTTYQWSGNLEASASLQILPTDVDPTIPGAAWGAIGIEGTLSQVSIEPLSI